jgi:hypothetical protein
MSWNPADLAVRSEQQLQDLYSTCQPGSPASKQIELEFQRRLIVLTRETAEAQKAAANATGGAADAARSTAEATIRYTKYTLGVLIVAVLALGVSVYAAVK